MGNSVIVTGTAEFLFEEREVLRTHIVLVEVRHLALPTGIRSFRLPDGRQTPTDVPVLLVRLTDTDGVHGYALLWAQQAQQLRLVEACLGYLAHDVTQYSLSEIPRLTKALSVATAFLGGQGALAFGVSGITMALEDLVCRRRDTSLSAAIGRRRERIRAYQTGLMLHASIEELIAEADQIYRRGMRAVKMLVGKPTLDEDVDRVQAVRQALPADAVLMVDALQRWTVPEAICASQRFADFGLTWIEDPIAQDDTSGYRLLAQESPIPVATGETVFAAVDFDALLAGGIHYIVGEPERIGGLCAWADVAGAVHQAGGTMLPHLYPHVSAQLGATLRQDETWIEYVPWFEPLVAEPLIPDGDGFFAVNASAGSGFTPDLDAVDALARGSWHRLND